MTERPDVEEPLRGGNVSARVVRVGDTVRRPAGPHTPAVHALRPPTIHCRHDLDATCGTGQFARPGAYSPPALS